MMTDLAGDDIGAVKRYAADDNEWVRAGFAVNAASRVA